MKNFTSASLWIIIFLVVILLFMNYQNREQPEEITILEWRDRALAGQIQEAVDEGGLIKGFYLKNGQDKTKYKTEYTDFMAASVVNWAKDADDAARANGKKFAYTVKKKNPLLQSLIISLVLPLVVIIGLWMLLMRQLQGTGNKAMSFGKSKAKLVQEGQIKITFKDVAGIDEARDELVEIVEYLEEPKKFSRLGGRIPKGVLLVGQPGTGKTLMAKAIAGEAKVPFFSISGSDFVEMFVGVGASRVRDLFEQAKKSKPCIVFIDEIDAVGRSRFAGIGGSHDEREQTLNQLLVEMDGFTENEGVILIAATNRPDVLDPALLRPGRFDRQIMVPLPDVRGREKILDVHAAKVKIQPEVNLKTIAKSTPGFSGADLANLINEAALLAARANLEAIGMPQLEEAKDRVMMGPERRSLVISEKEKLVTAYHEVGHALVAYFTPGGESVHKVTIIPRGPALGVTWILPNEERHTVTRQELMAKLYYGMGGRAAEEIRFGEITTGAASDLEHGTDLARRMVTVYGMSDRLGPRTFGEPNGHVFLGKEMTRERNYSDETATVIDEEIRKLLDEAYATALNLLREKQDVMERVAAALVERETIDGEELRLLIEGKTLPPLDATPPKKRDEAPEEPKKKEVEKRLPKIDPLAGPQAQPSA